MAQEQQREELLIRDRVTGQPRPYYVDAKNINLGDDETYKSLPDVLGEMQDDIDDAKEHGGGSVTGVKVGNTTYEPDSETGVVDISPAIPDVSGKANKSEMSIVPGTGANADKTTITLKEGTSATVLTQHQDISMKANSSEVVKGIKDSNGNPLPKNQDGTITLPAVQAGDKVSVIQPDPADGTFTIRVGSDDFTVNLNHTHEGMAKLVVCEESDLPSTLDPATIYAITDSGETEIEKLIIRGMEFAGGVPDTGMPQVTKPSVVRPLNLGNNTGSGVTALVDVKARNLNYNGSTDGLTVSVGQNSGLLLSYGQTSDATSITIPQLDAETGCQITVKYTGSGALDDGALVFSHDNAVLSSVVVVVVVVVPAALEAIKITGTQWLQTDYKPNANTEFQMVMKFSTNSKSQTPGSSSEVGIMFLSCPKSSADKRFEANVGSVTNDAFAAYLLGFVNEDSIMNGSNYQQVRFDANSNKMAEFLSDHAVISYSKSASQGVFTMNTGTNNSCATSLKTTEMDAPLAIGYDFPHSMIFERFDLTIYSFTITENGQTVRNYVPASLQGVPGLHDTVTGAFITSETNDNVVAIPLNS